MAHPVVALGDVPDLPPPGRRRRWRPHRPSFVRSLVGRFGSLAFLLAVALAVSAVAAVAYGYFYDRPSTAELPMPAACARPANALSALGRTIRARLSERVGTNFVRRTTLDGDARSAVSKAASRAAAAGAALKARQAEAQRFADGLEFK